MKLNWSSSFKRTFRKMAGNNPGAKEKIITTMQKLEQNPFMLGLKTHKLKGFLEGSYACNVDYDLRIVFTFEKNKETGATEILLIDVGTHKEVY